MQKIIFEKYQCQLFLKRNKCTFLFAFEVSRIEDMFFFLILILPRIPGAADLPGKESNKRTPNSQNAKKAANC